MSLKPAPVLRAILSVALLASFGAHAAAADDNEMPAKFTPVTRSFDFTRREVMIPMRDGVKLHTVILVPKGAHHAPILLTRTPYDANALTSHAESTHLASVLEGYDNATDVIVEGGYIRVVQDVRGKYGSEGTYVMNRPLAGTPENPGKVDNATDTWDTIDWLVKHVPESNGKVGILGISYDGFLPLMALIHPHPALKVAVPMNPMVDGWRGDDWFHNGAFREQMLPYIYEQESSKDSKYKWWSSTADDYDAYLRAGSAGAIAKAHGLEQEGFWRKLVAHPAYDAFWSDQAVDQVLAKEPLAVPTMLVSSLWDQEDIYGAMAVYRALEQKPAAKDKLFLVLGPWHHGQEIGDGRTLGPVRFDQDTALYFREKVLAPFLAHYLKDGAPAMHVSHVTAFRTGVNEWEHLDRWPAGCADGCQPVAARLYLRPGLGLSFHPAGGQPQTEDYVSDPSRPVPNRPTRPILPVGHKTGCEQWACWLVDDQRNAAARPDVLTFTSDVLTEPVVIAGRPIVHLTASTSGTDSDWVVKLIDVYPDEVAAQPEMSGYQLPIAMDIFRGRYRESLSHPEPLKPNVPLAYRFALPTANHVFLPGHRIMVQVQSSWFPLYDRNPQRFVRNIFWARPQDFIKARQRVVVAGPHESYLELPLVK